MNYRWGCGERETRLRYRSETLLGRRRFHCRDEVGQMRHLRPVVVRPFIGWWWRPGRGLIFSWSDRTEIVG